MKKLEGVGKVSFTPTSPRITVLKSVVDALGLSTRDRICFVVGETVTGEHRVEARLNLADRREIKQPGLPLFESMVRTCMAIRSTTRQIHYVSISSRILAHHTFHMGDKFRWTILFDDDDSVSMVRIEYIPTRGQ